MPPIGAAVREPLPELPALSEHVASERPTPRPLAARLRAKPALAAMIAAYALVFGALSFLKHHYALYADFDLAIFTQALDRLMHGSTFVSIRGMSWLGDHASFLLLPLVPIYAAAPHPLTLLFVQTLALALGAIPVFRMARRAVGSDGAALACAALYLAYPAVGYTNLFEFHPEVLCTAMLLCAFDAVFAGSRRAAIAWACVSLLGKEDVALVVFAMGVWAGVARRDRRLALALCGISVAWFALVVGIVRPLANQGEAGYGRMYAAWGEGFGEIVANVVTHPVDVLRAFVSTPGNPIDTRLKQELLLQLTLPLAFLPLLAPWTAAVALPVLAAHLLSWRVQQHTIVFQYTALMTPVLFAAAIEALSMLRRWRVDALRGALLAAGLACVVSQITFGPFTPWPALRTASPLEHAWPSEGDRIMARYRDTALERAPRHRGIVAGFDLLPRVTHRESVHALHHVISGRYTFSTQEYPLPLGVSGIVGDLSHPRLLPYVDAQSPARLARVIESNGLMPAYATGDVVCFAYEPSASMTLVEPARDAPVHKVGAEYEGELDLIGVSDLSPTDDAHVVELTTDWCRTAPMDRVALMELTLRDASGRSVLTHVRALGYVAWAPSTWRQDQPMRERYRLVITRSLPPGEYALDMRMLWKRGASVDVYRSPDAADGFVRLGRIRIGNGA